MTVKIYHNPRCSKSRATLARLAEKGIEPEVIPYLATPPTVEDIKEILKALGMKSAELIRKGGDVYRELQISQKDYSDEELVEFMHRYPILIERPIVVYKERAALGRPPENIDILFEK